MTCVESARQYCPSLQEVDCLIHASPRPQSPTPHDDLRIVQPRRPSSLPSSPLLPLPVARPRSGTKTSYGRRLERRRDIPLTRARDRTAYARSRLRGALRIMLSTRSKSYRPISIKFSFFLFGFFSPSSLLTSAASEADDTTALLSL